MFKYYIHFGDFLVLLPMPIINYTWHVLAAHVCWITAFWFYYKWGELSTFREFKKYFWFIYDRHSLIQSSFLPIRLLSRTSLPPEVIRMASCFCCAVPKNVIGWWLTLSDIQRLSKVFFSFLPMNHRSVWNHLPF